MIPLYKNIAKDKMNEIRKMVFDDIIRPLHNPKLLKELLINLDLVSSGLKDFAVEDFEEKIVEHLDEKSLPAVSLELINHISTLRKALDTHQEVEIIVAMKSAKRLTRKVFNKLISLDSLDEELFTKAAREGIITVDDIPVGIRNKVMKNLSLNRFLKSPSSFYKELNSIVDEQEIRNKLQLLAEFLPALYSLGMYKEILEIAMLYEGKGIRLEMGNNNELLGAISQAVAEKAESANKEEQIKLFNVLPAMDSLGDYLLVDLLDNRNRSVRRMVIEMLPNRGPAIIPFVLSALKRKGGWHFLRNAIIILSKTGAGNPEVLEMIRQSLTHTEPNLRKEAAAAISALMMARGESLLVQMLGDKDTDVRKKILISLSSFKSVHPEFIRFISDTLKSRGDEVDPFHEPVLNVIPDISVPAEKKQEIEDSLITILKESSGFSTFIRRAQPSTQVKAGVIKSLGSLGTSKSLKILQKQASDRNPAISRAVSEAIQKIQLRK
jgi:HEAT repeat protein